jgi:uncharacterized delta-60 repeat protein
MYAADGDLDMTFGVGGKVISDIPGFSNGVMAVAADAQGRLVVAGFLLSEYEGPYQALARYNADGSLDSTFGTNGIASGDAIVDDLVLDRDGKIVIVSMLGGYATISRYGDDGRLDSSFGVGGRQTTACGAWPSVAIDAADRIVVAGSSYIENATVFCVARYHADGSPDLTFGTAGVTTTRMRTISMPNALSVHRDGRIVLAGYTYDPGSPIMHAALAGYTDNGSLDSEFGSSGTIIEDFGTTEGFSDVVFDREGRILATATFTAERRDFFAARYASNGTPDADFNGNGRVIVDFAVNAGYYDARAQALALDERGRIVLVGTFDDILGEDAVLARLNPDGSLDASFGADGRIRTSFGELDFVAAVAVDPAGRIVLGGSVSSGGRYDFDFALARYEAGAIGYQFSGFFAPVDNLPARNVVKAGRAVPVKFSLNGYHGMDILAAGSPASQPIACDAQARLDVLEETVTATGSSLTYDAAKDQYLYVWRTEKAWANTCRRLVVTLSDGTRHVADFQLSN